PKGLPIATTQSPTLRPSESPSLAVGRLVPASIFSTARSVFGSRPITLALNSRPSFDVTVISFAFSTTWLLVRTTPSLRITKPEPEPCWVNPPPRGGLGRRKPPKGPSSSPNPSGGKPNGRPFSAAFTTDTTLMWTTAGEASAARGANDGGACPPARVAVGASGAVARAGSSPPASGFVARGGPPRAQGPPAQGRAQPRRGASLRR